MKLNRGCGCMLLVLAAFNAMLIIGSIFSLTAHRVTFALGILIAFLFVANSASSAMLGYAAIRGEAVTGTPRADASAEDGATEGVEEGEE